jgi:predicted N-acyltransferase
MCSPLLQSTFVEVQVLPLLSALGSSDWNTLTANASFYYTRGWLEAVAPDLGKQSLLLVAYRSGHPVAALPAFRVTNPNEYVYHNVLDAVLESDQMAEVTSLLFPRAPRIALRLGRVLLQGLRPFLNRALFPNLTLTSPFAYVSEILVHPDEQEPAQVIDVLIAALERYSDAIDSHCVAFLWVDGTQDLLLSVLQRRQYRIAFSGAEERLSIRWTSLYEYFQSFSVTKRHHFKKEVARFLETGLQVRSDIPWESVADRALDLAMKLQKKHGHDLEADRLAHRFRSLINRLGTRSVTLTVWQEDELVAFVTSFQHGNILYPKLAGFDYEKTSKGYVYFNVAYYHLIELAIELGVREINYGSGTHEAKLMRGCQMVPLYNAYRFKSRWINRLADLYLPSFHQRKSWRYRCMASNFGVGGGAINVWQPDGDILPNLDRSTGNGVE